MAWVTQHRAARGERAAHDGVVLGRAHVTRREHGAVLADEREHFERLGEQRVVGVGDDEARAGDAELRGDTVDEVLPARQRRKPDDLGAESQRDLDRRGVHAADLAVATDAAEDGDAVTSCCTAHASAAVGKSCDLSTIAR